MPHSRAGATRSSIPRAAAARAAVLLLVLSLCISSLPTASALDLEPCSGPVGAAACHAGEALKDNTVDRFNEFRDWLDGLSNEVKAFFNNPIDFIGKVIGSIFTSIFHLAAKGLTALANAGARGVLSAFSAMGTGFDAARSALFATGRSAGDALMTAISSVYTTTATTFAGLGVLAPVVASLVVGGLAGGIIVAVAWLVGAVKTAAGTYLTGGILK